MQACSWFPPLPLPQLRIFLDIFPLRGLEEKGREVRGERQAVVHVRHFKSHLGEPASPFSVDWTRAPSLLPIVRTAFRGADDRCG